MNLISSENVIAKVYRDFKPGISGWELNAIEWIGEVLNDMQAVPNYDEIITCVQIDEYRGKLPCHEAAIISLEYEGENLPITGEQQFNHYRAGTDTGRTFAKITGNFLKTSFETGQVNVEHYITPRDKNGFPLVPDNEACKEAMTHRILLGLMSQGFRHPVLGNDYWGMKDRVDIMIQHASNEITMPSQLDSEVNKAVWNSNYFDSNLSRSFFARVNKNDVRKGLPPGTLEDKVYGTS